MKVVSFSSLREHYNREIQAEHAHDFYIVAFFEKGQCLYYRNFEEILINPKTIVFMPPGQYHHYGEGEIKGSSICFSHDAFIGLDIEVVNLIDFYLFVNESVIKIEDEHIYHEFADIVKMIHSEYECKEHPLTLNIKMKSLLHYWLIKLFDYYSQHHEIDIQRNSNLFLSFYTKVEKNFKKWHKVAQYAEDLHVSYKELSRLVRAETNKRPIEIIIDRIISEAKRLLVFTNKSIKEISVELGFEELSNFSLLFKKKIGVSPNVYRSNYSKKK
ncbi:helix-turn-helix domain-containing protein [Xylanibacter muris]|uniref:helix-turn-helix domain-containing protein n=1 Tax=Xylanibacter muris TaxID=2736290 RepID=UPI002557CA05|nr:AraC family transcriptional regulator [Xylanibacter muris]